MALCACQPAPLHAATFSPEPLGGTTATGAHQTVSQTPNPTRENPAPSRTAISTPSISATSSTVTQSIPLGRPLSIQVLSSTQYGQSIEFYIYLPPAHNAQTGNQYPTLVLLHGQGYAANQWPALGLSAVMDQLIASGQMPPTIVLLPFERYDLQDPSESSFDALIDEVMLPWAIQNLSACSERSCLGIGGISRGGAWALRMGMDYPDAFGFIGMHSAPPFANDHYRLVYLLNDMDPALRPHLYLDAGEQDLYRQAIQAFHEDLQAFGIDHAWRSAPGEHGDAYWQAHLETYMQWYGEMLFSGLQ